MLVNTPVAIVPAVAIAAIAIINPLYHFSSIPVVSTIQLLPVNASWYSAVANAPVNNPAPAVTPPTILKYVAPLNKAPTPLIYAGMATIVKPIAVITLLSDATPPIVNPIPTNAVNPRIQASTGKHPLGST